MALRYFRQRLGRPLTIIWDRLSAHKAKEVTAFLAAHPEDYVVAWLPPYAPDLNPEEMCNGAVKRDTLNAVPHSVDALLHQARRAFNRLGRRIDTLDNFFRHVGLDVT